MGSDSDLPTMVGAIAVCEEFNIPHEVAIVSAHRTPERMFEYAKTAHLRGLKVIIAGAGGAAHLPGMVASLTPLPVIGVPVKLAPYRGLILCILLYKCLEEFRWQRWQLVMLKMRVY